MQEQLAAARGTGQLSPTASATAPREALGRLPLASEPYTSTDHQLNLLCFHELLFAAMKEKEDLRSLLETA